MKAEILSYSRARGAFAGDHLPGALKQYLQDLEGLPRQAQADTMFSEFLRQQVCFKWAEGNKRGRLFASRHPALLGAQAYHPGMRRVSDYRHAIPTEGQQPLCFV